MPGRMMAACDRSMSEDICALFLKGERGEGKGVWVRGMFSLLEEGVLILSL